MLVEWIARKGIRLGEELQKDGLGQIEKLNQKKDVI